MSSSTARARRAVLVTAVCTAVYLAAQQLPSVEALNQSYVACVQSAFVRHLDDFAVNGNVPQATERALLDCQPVEDVLYTTAVALAPGNSQAIALVRAAIEQGQGQPEGTIVASAAQGPKAIISARSSEPIMSQLTR
jgi:hypothetical protein